MNHPQIPAHDGHFGQYASGEWFYELHPPGVGHIALNSAREHRRMIACVARCGWLDEAAHQMHTCTNYARNAASCTACRACAALRVAEAWRAWGAE